MANHAWGYEPGPTDVHDTALLHERLGTVLVPPFDERYQTEVGRSPGSQPFGPSTS